MIPPARAFGAPPLPWGLAWRLSVGQIFSWGILYYAFTVVVGPMQAATGWERTFLNLGLSLGLLAWGLCAYPVGLYIQRRGARGVMTLASAAGSAALVLMGTTSTPVAYLGAWILLGASMAGLLYDSAFAVVTAAFGEHYRRGITLITLVGGLASTVFIPLAQLAVDQLGWKLALVALGGLQGLVCIPLHRWGLPATLPAPDGFEKPHTPPGGRIGSWWHTLRADVSDPRFVGLAIAFTAHAAAFTGLIFQVIPVLQALGAPSATIVGAIAIMGPMQVAGRLFLSIWGARFSSLRVGVYSMAGLLGAMLLLLFVPPTLFWLSVFAAGLGLGNGMLTIVRGTSVAELFDRSRYAEINGALSAPAVLAKAAAPLVLAGIWSATGSARSVPLVVSLVVIIGTAALIIVLRRTALPTPPADPASAPSALPVSKA